MGPKNYQKINIKIQDGCQFWLRKMGLELYLREKQSRCFCTEYGLQFKIRRLLQITKFFLENEIQMCMEIQRKK